MKKSVVFLGLFLLVLAALPALAADMAKPAASSWTGWITDSHCGAKGANAKHTKDCAEKCVKQGGKLQFSNDADHKLYDIDKADMAMGHIGHQVKVTGHVDGTMIHVESIEMVPAPPTK